MRRSVLCDRLRYDRTVRGTMRQVNFTRVARIRRGAVPIVLTKHSIVTGTPANANGAYTFNVPITRRVSPTLGTPRTIVLTPAHRLTRRVTRRLAKLACFVPRIRIIYICNNTGVRGRTGHLTRNYRVIITAPNHLVSRCGRRGVSLSRIARIILSRTSRVLGVNFCGSIGRVVNLVGTHGSLSVFSTAVDHRIVSVN